jgi:hypothetical protein
MAYALHGACRYPTNVQALILDYWGVDPDALHVTTRLGATVKSGSQDVLEVSFLSLQIMRIMDVASHTRPITPPSVACAVHLVEASARRVRARETEEQEDKTDQRVCVISRGASVLVSRPSRLLPSPLGGLQRACAPREPDGSAPQHRQVRRQHDATAQVRPWGGERLVCWCCDCGRSLSLSIYIYIYI